MEKNQKLKKRNHRAYYTTTGSPTKSRNVSLLILVWRSLRNAGLVMNLVSGGIHWIANVATVIFVFTTTMQVAALFLVKDDSERLFESFSVLSFCGMGVIKLFSLRFNGNQWRTLLNKATELESQEFHEENNPSLLEYDTEDDNSSSVSNYTERYTKSFKATLTILTRIYSVTAVVFIISPFIEYALYKYNDQESVNYPHILSIWAPLDRLTIFGYLLTIFIETVSSVYCVCVHVAFDLSVVGLMMFVRGQFSLLHAKSELIGGKGKKCIMSKARDERAHVRIKSCHRVHVTIIHLVKQLNELTKNILGIYFCTATITLCLVAVQLKSELSTTQLISLLQYMGATLTQLFLFCNYGDAVLNESGVGMGRGPYASAWWCLSPRIRKELHLLAMGMSRRYQLHAGPFFSLSLPSFIQVVRTAYSYYAVLRKKSS